MAETLGLKMGSTTPTTHQMYEWNYFIITEETIIQVNVTKWPQKMLRDTEEWSSRDLLNSYPTKSWNEIKVVRPGMLKLTFDNGLAEWSPSPACEKFALLSID